MTHKIQANFKCLTFQYLAKRLSEIQTITTSSAQALPSYKRQHNQSADDLPTQCFSLLEQHGDQYVSLSIDSELDKAWRYSRTR